LDEPTAPPAPGNEPLQPPAAPVALDLTQEGPATPGTPTSAVESALQSVSARTKRPVSELTRQIDSEAQIELRSVAEDKTPTYAPRDRAQDSARQIITLWLIGLFCVLIILVFAALFMIGLKNGFNKDFYEKLKAVLDVLLGPVITLLSSAIGFYFGYQQGSGSLNKDNVRESAVPKSGSRR
jgi:hypothetical protein